MPFNTRFTKMTIFCHCLSKRLFFIVLLIPHSFPSVFVFFVFLLIETEGFKSIRERVQSGRGKKVTPIFLGNESLREGCDAPLAAGKCMTVAAAADKKLSSS